MQDLFLRAAFPWRSGFQRFVQLGKDSEKPFYLFLPSSHRHLTALLWRKKRLCVQQESRHMQKNLTGFPHSVAGIEIAEIYGSAKNYVSAAVGKRGQEMPKKISLCITRPDAHDATNCRILTLGWQPATATRPASRCEFLVLCYSAKPPAGRRRHESNLTE